MDREKSKEGIRQRSSDLIRTEKHWIQLFYLDDEYCLYNSDLAETEKGQSQIFYFVDVSELPHWKVEEEEATALAAVYSFLIP